MMNSKDFHLLPTYDPSVDEVTKNDYDFSCSDSLNTLSYTDVISRFEGRSGALEYYKDILSSGYPRTAAFLMAKVVRGELKEDGHEAVKSILLENISLLPDEKMATKADALITKIGKTTKRKKILFSSAQWLTGGMERVMSTLFNELKSDYEIYLITPWDKAVSSIIVPDFVTSIKIDADLFGKHFDSLILTYALIFEIDVIIGYMNLFEKQLNLYDICAGTKIKTIASTHEYYFYPYKSPYHRKVVKKRLLSFGKCNAIVWPLSFNAALSGLYVDNNYVIGNPNNFEVISGKLPSKDNNVICVGRFNDYVKRIDRIIECFALVLKKVPDAKLTLVGKCERNERIGENGVYTVNDLINKFEIPAGSVEFAGEVSNIDDYYKKAKVLMLTSNSEGFGMVVNEAACFGVPSVCNFIPGVEDIVNDGQNGFITDQNDLVSMALKISDILEDDKLHENLSNDAREKVEQFNSRNIGDKWRYLIKSLTEVDDEKELQTKLSSKLGYSAKNDQLLKVVSKEFNEIYYSLLEEAQPKNSANNHLILFKIKRLPKRLKANIEYEGWLKTGGKIITRTYKIARKKLMG